MSIFIRRLVLVDDGSTDGSECICDEYAAAYENVKVIHKANGGLISTRKAGIKIANGDLIGYVDSDDYIEVCMYEKLYCHLLENNADIAICGHYEEFEDDFKISDSVIAVKNHVGAGVYDGELLADKFYSQMLYNKRIERWGVSPAFWDKLYRRELIYDLQLSADDRIWDGEDHVVVYPAMLNAGKIVVIDDMLYHHAVRCNSVATGYDSRAFERFNILYNHLKEIFDKSKHKNILYKQFPYQMRWFLYKHIHTELGIQPIDEDKYMRALLFPFERVEKNAKIILYGAGVCGYSFYRQIHHTKGSYCDIVAWVDKNSHSEIMQKMKIVNPFDFDWKNTDYDYVVIAAEYEDTANAIRKDLHNFPVDDSKIIWKQPNI